MARDLSAYIKEQLKKGYTKEQVSSYLRNYGYTEEQIKQAMPGFSLFQKNEADPRLVAYIRQYSQRGYTRDQMQNYLSRYYPADQLKLAMREAGTVHHVIHLSNKTILIAIMMVAAAGGLAAMLVFMGNGQPGELLDYKITTAQLEVEPGKQLVCTNEFQNRGSRRYDITVENRIVNEATGEVLVGARQSTVEVTTIDESVETFSIPDDAPAGRYRVEGAARYSGQTATASASFRIIRPEDGPTCSDGIKNQGETEADCGGPCPACTEAASCYDKIRNQGEIGIDCGGPCPACTATCYDNIRNQDETGVDCGGKCPACSSSVIPDNDQILDKVKTLGSFNEAESARLCGSMTDIRLQNNCYEYIAAEFSTSGYCAMIAAQSQANRCYMHFVMNKDYSVCEKIDDIYLRKNCESMRDIDSIVGTINETQAQLPEGT